MRMRLMRMTVARVIVIVVIVVVIAFFRHRISIVRPLAIFCQSRAFMLKPRT